VKDLLNQEFDDETVQNIIPDKDGPTILDNDNNDNKENDQNNHFNHENQNPNELDNENNNNEPETKIEYDGNIDIRTIKNDPRPFRIYLDGVFDMAHYGHYRLFKQVKDHFPNSYIIVGVSSDEETLRLKGQTLMNEDERAESIGHCKWVNEVIMPCPWIITQEFIDQHKIDYVAHDGDPYVSSNHADIYDFVKKQGKFIATQRTDGVSTTDIINRIIRRYNEFVLRNLQRGVSREELNLSWTRQKRIQFQAELEKKNKILKKLLIKQLNLWIMLKNGLMILKNLWMIF